MKKIVVLIALFLWLPCLANAGRVHSFWQATLPAADLLVLRLEQSRGNVSAAQRQWVAQLYRLAAVNRRIPALRWRALYWDAFILKQDGREDDALARLETALKIADKDKYPYDYERISGSATSYRLMRQGNYFKCYLAYCKSLEYFQSIDDKLMTAFYQNAIGAIFNNLGEPAMALNYFRTAKRLYGEGGSIAEAAKQDLNIAISLAALGKHTQSMALLRRLDANTIAHQDTAFHIKLLTSLAAGSNPNAGNMQEHYVMRMLDLSTRWHDSTLLMRSKINVGAFYIGKRQYVKALPLYLEAYPYMKKIHNSFSVLACLDGISLCHYRLHHDRQAADCYHLFISTKDSLTQANHVADIQNYESLSKIKEYNRNIQEEHDKANARFHATLLVTVLVILFLCAVCYLLWTMRQKERIRKQLKEVENESLSRSLEVEQLLNRKHQLEIETQNRKLTIDAMRLSEGENILKSMHRQIVDASSGKKKTSEVAQALENQIKLHTGDEDEWESFRMSFEKVHPEFFTFLKHHFSNLSENELRLCAFIRAGMPNKQIAYMLNIQPASLKKARFRIRRKVNLATGASLEDFLREIKGEVG